MKTFCFTSRDNTGALKKGSIQAVDRADALRQIKSKGCVPVSVTEGSGIATGTRELWSPALTKLTLGLAGSVVIVVALWGVWRTYEKRMPVKSAALKTENVALSTRAVHVTKPENPSKKVVPVAPTLQPIADVAAPPSPAVPQPIENQPATPSQPVPVEPQPPQPPQPPNPYKSQTEQLLAMAMSVSPGTSVPPLPLSPSLETDFSNSLTNVIVIYSDDDAKTANTKENVAVAKNQLLELVKNGRSVSEVLKEYQDTVNGQVELRNQAQQELNALYQSGKTEEAQSFLEKINSSFKEQGIQGISVPRSKK